MAEISVVLLLMQEVSPGGAWAGIVSRLPT